MGKKYLTISYSVPATIGINFEYDPAEWNALTEEQKETIFMDGIRNADAVLGSCLDGSDGGEPTFNVNGYIPNRKGFDQSTVEIEEEETWGDDDIADIVA